MPRDPLHDFWVNIQYAHHFMPPLAVSNPQRLSPEEVKKEFFLTPHTAEGFKEELFASFLPSSELVQLKQAVKEVRAVADELKPGTVATPRQRDRALVHFQDIVDILAPDRYAGAEALVIGKRIEAKLRELKWPEKLDHLRFMTGLDSTGEPAVWIWAYTKEKVSGEYDQEAFFAAVDEIDPILKQAGEAVAPDRWPYISYRSTLDQHAYEAVA